MKAGQKGYLLLQRQHIEVSITCLSGARLCAALACSRHGGSAGDAAFLLLVHGLSLLLEFGPASHKIASPYQLRKSGSHGIAQGVLAVPSVLAALVAAAPADGWQSWLHGSCWAAVAVLLTIYLQSSTAPETAREINATVANLYTADKNCELKSQDSIFSKVAGSERHLSQRLALCGAGAAVFMALLVSAAQQTNHRLGSAWLDLQLSSPGRWMTAAAAGGISPLLWAGLAAGSFCCSLQLLPGCFSLGEAALMAQGAACLLVAACQSLQHAALFMPAFVCQRLSHSLQVHLNVHGACVPGVQDSVFGLQHLPAAIVLVLAAAVLPCLLLRLLLQTVCRLAVSYTPVVEHAVVKEQQPDDAAPAVTPTPAGGRPQQSLNGCGSQCWTKSKDSDVSSNGGTCKAFPARDSCSCSKPSMLLLQGVHAGCAVALVAAISLLLLFLGCAAVWTLSVFLPAQPGRVGVLLYWVALLTVTLPALRLWASRSNMPQIILRKVYHLLAIGLFVPVFFWDLQLLALSLAIAFAALVLLEIIRCCRLPVLGQAVQQFMQEFVDERDSGVIFITHFTLLLGLAVPIWLCLGLPTIKGFVGPNALLHDSPGDGSRTWPVLGGVGNAGSEASRWSDPAAALLLVVSGLSGIIIIGVGDTAASLVGKLLGRVPIHEGSNKTVEGTVAGIASSVGAWALLLWWVGLMPSVSTLSGLSWWLKLGAVTAGAGLMEAATSQLDNILLPLWYLPHLLLL